MNAIGDAQIAVEGEDFDTALLFLACKQKAVWLNPISNRLATLQLG